jgi:hypothetical protein
MIHKVSDQQTQEEMQSGYKPIVLDSSFAILPFNNLGDREFELLCYSLVKEEIKKQQHQDLTDIVLMQGVGERGRDCVLYGKDGVSGLIQCKKYAGRLTKPQLLKELIKFALYASKDSSILPDRNNFKYLIYVSNDFTEPANDLLHKYSLSILDDIKNGNIDKYIKEIVEEYESFQKERSSPPLEEVKKILTSIKVEAVNGTDLTNRIYTQPTILKNFFNVRTVVSIVDADQVMRKALDDYGLRLLTDEDLKSIQARISQINPDHRVGFGFVDFYGYSIDFFRSLKSEEYGEILNIVSNLQMALNRKLLDFIRTEMDNLILSEVTCKLLGTRKIHQISVGVCAPYLLKRVLPNVMNNGIPDFLLDKIFMGKLESSENVIADVVEKLMKTSEKIMAEDYSNLVGDDELIEMKKELFKHMHQGLPDITAARERIELDLSILRPVLKSMEDKLNQSVSAIRTIVISDSSFLNNKDKVVKILETCTKIGPLL